jgi:hypothetical protein
MANFGSHRIFGASAEGGEIRTERMENLGPVVARASPSAIITSNR